MPRTNISVACVIALTALLATTSHAGINGELRDSIATEIEAVGELLEAIDATVVASERGKMSPKGAKAHSDAKAAWKQAKADYRANKHEDAYRNVRKAKKAVMPAATEVFKRGVPEDAHKAVALQVQCTAKRVAAIADQVEGNATATASYKEAKKLYEQGKAFYEQGKAREAFRTLEKALNKLDVAIQALR